MGRECDGVGRDKYHHRPLHLYHPPQCLSLPDSSKNRNGIGRQRQAGAVEGFVDTLYLREEETKIMSMYRQLRVKRRIRQQYWNGRMSFLKWWKS